MAISTPSRTVVIDGSKFKAVNHRDRNFTRAKLQRRVKELEEGITHYLMEMDTADRQEPEIAQLRTERLKDKIAALKEQLQAMRAVKKELDTAPDGQLSQTDPDARSMKTRGTGVVGYNVQASVETKPPDHRSRSDERSIGPGAAVFHGNQSTRRAEEGIDNRACRPRLLQQ